MKLFHKIFLCFVVIFSITFQIAGFLLVNFSYKNAISQGKKYAIQEYQYNKYILQSLMLSEQGILNDDGALLANRTKSFTTAFAIYDEMANCLFSNLAAEPELKISNSQESMTNFQLQQDGKGNYVYVYGSVSQNKNRVIFVTETNISQTVSIQQEMADFFQKVFLIILGIVFPIIIFLSGFLTRNINKVSKGSRRIAEGNYAERIPMVGKDEIGELADDFNKMALSIEEKIKELSNHARAKEDFAANFAHELKTPLTSVIGYADMLYQKDLQREQVKSAAEYILNEGMRLESLSLKLMDLFVLDKQDFYLESVEVKEVFDALMPEIKMLCEKRNVDYHMDIDAGSIQMDYDLFKTSIVNLLDNAIKAECRDIWIDGRGRERGYQIFVRDNGKGIPSAELGRITEAFYMVDKSRARKQHGAGLGMALVARIAEIHGAELSVDSDGRTGTTIGLIFGVRETCKHGEEI